MLQFPIYNNNIKNNKFIFILLFFLLYFIKCSESLEAFHVIDSSKTTNSHRIVSCLFNHCSAEGGPCDTGSNVINGNGNRCYQPLRCIDGTCAKFIPNDNCTYNYDCDELRGEYCIKNPGEDFGVCLIANYAQHGEFCYATYDCMFNMVCDNRTCQTPPSGCIYNEQCSSSSSCQNGQCVELQFEENECSLYSSYKVCEEGYCGPRSNDPLDPVGICQIPDIGSNCSTLYTSCDVLKGQYCKALDESSQMGTCQQTPEPSYNLCFTSADCKNYEYCKCDRSSSVGYCYTTAAATGGMCKMSNDLYLKCISRVGCQYAYNFHPSSCASKMCPDEAKCYRQFCVDPVLSSQNCYFDECKLSQNSSNHKYRIRGNTAAMTLVVNRNLNYYLLLSLFLLSFLI